MSSAPSSLSCLVSVSMLIGACTLERAGVSPEPASVFDDPSYVVAANSLTAELIRGPIVEIADDRYEGRLPGTTSDFLTQAYLGELLDEAGFAPAGPGGDWIQPFDLVGINTAQPETWSFTDGETFLELIQSEEFILASGLQESEASIFGAEVVFVGYGIQAPEHDWDDFKGVDLRGKVLLMLNNDPDWDPTLFAGETRLYYGRWSYKYESAARQGAVGAIVIHTTPSAGYPWQVVQTSWTGEQFQLPAGDEPRLQVEAWVTEDAARRLLTGVDLVFDELEAAARSRDFEPIPLGLTTSIDLTAEISGTRSGNVLGILEGSDPELSQEVVIYIAHHDHLGVSDAVETADRIFNGARDNAAGVGVVTAIARVFGSLPRRPRRSILIAFVGAEEQGLLGSEYFATNPIIQPGRIAGAVNYDSPNIWGATEDITFVGLGKSTLDTVAQAVADYQGRVVRPDQFPDRGYFYRSDQFSLARIGVPALYLNGGTEFIGRPAGWGEQQINAYTSVNYHQPSDELTADWNFDGMVQDASFGFWAGLIIANADDLPAWVPGDEFEADRLEALAVLE